MWGSVKVVPHLVVYPLVVTEISTLARTHTYTHTQAEHDVEARPILICTHAPLVTSVEAHVKTQLEALPQPNCDTARAAVAKGFAVVVESMEEAVKLSDSISPEHLEIMTANAMDVGMKCNHYGGLFIGVCACVCMGV